MAAVALPWQQAPRPQDGFVYAAAHYAQRGADSDLGLGDQPTQPAPTREITAEVEAAWDMFTGRVARRPASRVPPAQLRAPAHNQVQAAVASAAPVKAAWRPATQWQQQPAPTVAPLSNAGADEEDEDALLEQVAQFEIRHAAMRGAAQQPSAPLPQQRQPCNNLNPGAPAQPQVLRTMCSHGVPYALCMLQAQHLSEIGAQLDEAVEKMLYAEGTQVAELQQRTRGLHELKKALMAAPVPAQPWQQQQQQHMGPAGNSGNGTGGYVHGPNNGNSGSANGSYQQGANNRNAAAYDGALSGYQNGGGTSHTRSAAPAANAGHGTAAAASGLAADWGPRSAAGGGGFGGNAPGGGGGYGDGGAAVYELPAFGGQGDRDPSPPPEWQPDLAALRSVQGDRIEANADAQWRRQDFPWSTDMARVNRSDFGNPGFRMNQLQVCNATMSGKDVFVLMPTGGGKSLCYQLPAVLSPGLTVVASPLVSLIQDQVYHLGQMGIPAAALGRSDGDADWREQADVYTRAEQGDLKILFITPEKLVASAKLQNMLGRLHAAGMLSRVTIDEGHCVSQWGHDFRPAYTKLCFFKQKYPSVPVLVLTATATERVQHDIVAQLGIPSALVFRSSFNRANLRYEVRSKGNRVKALEEVEQMVLSRFCEHVGNRRQVQCGIIYCISRKETESLAADLDTALRTKLGRSRGQALVKHYHAGMEAAEKELVQNEWTNGEVPIIVATIAFGMGIDKPDVRFVVHFSVAKSLEGYLQESGRAGRDGREATCLLYYAPRDVYSSRRMIQQAYEESRAPEQPRRVQLEHSMSALNAMVSYCEEACRCRREMLLVHFGERFDAGQCRGTCDNCRQMAGVVVAYRDVSEDAKKVVEVVRCLGPLFSAPHVADVLRGSSNQQVKSKSHDQTPVFGLCKGMPKTHAERLVRKLVTEGILAEHTKRDNQHGQVTAHLAVDEIKAAALFAGQLKVKVTERGGSAATAGNRSPNGRQTKKARTKGTAPASAVPAGGGAGPSRMPSGLPIIRTARVSAKGQQHAAAAPRPGTGDAAHDAAAQEDIVDLVSDSDDEGEAAAAAAAAEQRLQMMKLTMRQLNAGVRELNGARQGPFKGPVQDAIAAMAPRSIEEFEKVPIPGLGQTNTQRYGRLVVAAVAEADAYLALVHAGSAKLEDFVLGPEVIKRYIVQTESQAGSEQVKRPRDDPGDADDIDRDWKEFHWSAADKEPPAKAARPAPPTGQQQQQQQRHAPSELAKYKYGGGGGGQSAQQAQQQRPFPIPQTYLAQARDGCVPGHPAPPRQHPQQQQWQQQRQQPRQQQRGGDEDVPLVQRQQQLKAKLQADAAGPAQPRPPPQPVRPRAVQSEPIKDVGNAFGGSGGGW